MKEEDDSLFCRKNARVDVRLVTTNGQEGIKATATQKVAQLRCFYTNEIWWNDSQLECCDGWLPTFQKK